MGAVYGMESHIGNSEDAAEQYSAARTASCAKGAQLPLLLLMPGADDEQPRLFAALATAQGRDCISECAVGEIALDEVEQG